YGASRISPNPAAYPGDLFESEAEVVSALEDWYPTFAASCADQGIDSVGPWENRGEFYVSPPSWVYDTGYWGWETEGKQVLWYRWVEDINYDCTVRLTGNDGDYGRALIQYCPDP